MWADREIDLTSRLLEFIGDLHARRPCADHQDRALRQLPGVVIGTGVDLVDSCGLRYDRRDDGLLERPGGRHDVARLDGAVGGLDVESRPAVVLSDRLHLDAGADRRVDLLRVRDEVVGNLFLSGERIGIDGELLARKPVVPGGPVGHQGVPPP